MFGDSKNIKDRSKKPLKDTVSLDVPYSNNHLMTNTYPKLNKLITALYIVTDIIDKTEPMRAKLRTLATDILSDNAFLSRSEIKDKVESILSLLDISLTIHLISEMNCNILKKEFMILYQSLSNDNDNINTMSPTWLEDFLSEPTLQIGDKGTAEAAEQTNQIGNNMNSHASLADSAENQFFVLKKQRREDIVQAIKDNGGSATITEVKLKASPRLANCGEKTLQRELVGMVRDNILDKTGEKRWSRYSLKNEIQIPSNETPT
jgi:hypothetical protein